MQSSSIMNAPKPKYKIPTKIPSQLSLYDTADFSLPFEKAIDCISPKQEIGSQSSHDSLSTRCSGEIEDEYNEEDCLKFKKAASILDVLKSSVRNTIEDEN